MALIGFGPFEVDTRSGERRRRGVRIWLQEQPFQILLILLEHAWEVVLREDLIGRLWPENTFVDFDRGLNKAINRLREALGDSADKPRFIETLPQRGYRFVAQVSAVARGASPESKSMARCYRRMLFASIPSRCCRSTTFPVIRHRNISRTA